MTRMAAATFVAIGVVLPRVVAWGLSGWKVMP